MHIPLSSHCSCCGHAVGGRSFVTPARLSFSRSQKLVKDNRCRVKSSENGASSGGGEKFVSLESVLSEVSALGDNFVFEDKDEESDVWDLESRVASSAYAQPAQAAQPTIKHALDPEQTAIDSAYSVEQGFKEMTVESLKADMASGSVPVVIDVRRPDEFASGHVPGAIHVCMDDLSESVKSGALDGYRGGRIALVCRSGMRSAQSAVRMTKVFGFEDIVNVKGGTLAWIDAGFDLEY